MLVPSLLFSVLAAAALGVSARRNPASDPRLTMAVLFLLLILPLLNLAPKFAVAVAGTSAGASATVESSNSWLIPAIWLAGGLLFSLRNLRDVIAMKKWCQRSSEAAPTAIFEETLSQLGMTQKIGLTLHPDLKSPVVAGLFKPTIYLPKSSRQWSPETLRMALLHELGHVQRRDLWMAFVAQVACLFHWFNPAVWWMRRVFLTQCEYACDAHLLRRGTDPQTYALALCDVAQTASTPALSLAMAGHAPLRDRIQLLSNARRRSMILPVIVLVTAGSAIAMSVVRLVPTDTSPADQAAALDETELRFTANPFPAD